MPRPAATLVVTVVALIAFAALRSRSDTAPAPQAKPAPAPSEAESPSALDHASWYKPTRSYAAARSGNSRNARNVGATGEQPEGVPDTVGAPRARANAGNTARAPRTSGTPDEFLSDSLFRQLDEDADGVLRGREVPAALRAELGPRAAVTADAFTPLFLATVARLRAERVAAATPAWYAELDPERTGRVSQARWQDAGRTVDEFRRIDTDGDGFVSQAEVVTFVTQPPLPASGKVEPLGFTTARTAATRPTALGAAGAPDASPAPADAKPQSRSDVLFDHYTATAASQPAAAPLRPRPRGTAAITVAEPKSSAPAPAPPPPPPPPPPRTPKPPISKAALPEPPTTHPYWAYRNAENISTLLSGARPDVLFLGDSITDFMARGDGKPLWNELYAPLTAHNFAIGGITTSHVLWQVETGQVAIAAPKTVVLLIGSNNLGNGQMPGDVYAGVQKIVSTLNAQLPNTEIMVVGLLPRGYFATDPFRVSIPLSNRLLAGVEGDRVTYLDVGAKFLSEDNSISPEVMPDGAHPNLHGYQLYTDGIWETLNGLMPKK